MNDRQVKVMNGVLNKRQKILMMNPNALQTRRVESGDSIVVFWSNQPEKYGRLRYWMNRLVIYVATDGSFNLLTRQAGLRSVLKSTDVVHEDVLTGRIHNIMGK